jgi:hypothetical protein
MVGVVGPMARSASDLRLLFSVLAAYDPEDPFSTPVPVDESPRRGARRHLGAVLWRPRRSLIRDAVGARASCSGPTSSSRPPGARAELLGDALQSVALIGYAADRGQGSGGALDTHGIARPCPRRPPPSRSCISRRARPDARFTRPPDARRSRARDAGCSIPRSAIENGAGLSTAKTSDCSRR